MTIQQKSPEYINNLKCARGVRWVTRLNVRMCKTISHTCKIWTVDFFIIVQNSLSPVLFGCHLMWMISAGDMGLAVVDLFLTLPWREQKHQGNIRHFHYHEHVTFWHSWYQQSKICAYQSFWCQAVIFMRKVTNIW